jgi:hypothetical protein
VLSATSSCTTITSTSRSSLESSSNFRNATSKSSSAAAAFRCYLHSDQRWPAVTHGAEAN